jgi:hypothetical protein
MSGKSLLVTQSRQFFDAVRALRALPSDQYRYMSLFAALFWDDAQLEGGEEAGDMPGNDGVLATHPLS